MSGKRPDDVDQPEAAVNRRGFLRAATGAASVAAASVVGGASPAIAAENDTERKKARYRDSDHVKAFYRTNRY